MKNDEEEKMQPEHPLVQEDQSSVSKPQESIVEPLADKDLVLEKELLKF
jgi:hypothetical protein